jgi:hypothetical protein
MYCMLWVILDGVVRDVLGHPGREFAIVRGSAEYFGHRWVYVPDSNGSSCLSERAAVSEFSNHYLPNIPGCRGIMKPKQLNNQGVIV